MTFVRVDFASAYTKLVVSVIFIGMVILQLKFRCLCKRLALFQVWKIYLMVILGLRVFSKLYIY